MRTSITLAPETVAAIDPAAGRSSRSRFIEEAVLEALADRERTARAQRDREILDQHADELNRETEDFLGYQVIVSG